MKSLIDLLHYYEGKEITLDKSVPIGSVVELIWKAQKDIYLYHIVGHRRDRILVWDLHKQSYIPYERDRAGWTPYNSTDVCMYIKHQPLNEMQIRGEAAYGMRDEFIT
jgi:hypothetical protein